MQDDETTLDLEVPAASHLPEIPQPGRRGAGGVAIPFDPMGYSVLRSLEEVEKKKEAGLGVLTPGQVADARRKAKFVPKFATLGSMYAEYPELVASGGLRIERVQPQWYDDEYGQKMRVCGTLAFKHPIIDDGTFARKFGGFKYRVFGVLEQENRENKGGPPQPVEIAVAEFEIPTPPNITNLPLMDGIGEPEGPMAQGYPQGAMYDMYSPYGRQRPGAPLPYPGPQGPNFDMYGPVISLAERAMARQDNNFPDAAWNVLGRQSEAAVSSLRETSDRQTQILMSQVERLERQLEEERRVAREQSNRPTDMVQMVDGMSRLVSSTKGSTDSEVLRQMRDDHERITRAMQNDHEMALSRAREEFDRTMSRLGQDADRTLAREREHSELRLRAAEARSKDLEAMLTAREREWRDEAERRETRAREDMQRSMDMRDREYSKRVEELNSAHLRERENLRELHERELRMNESVQGNTRSSAEQAHAIEMRAITTELAKVQAELSEKSKALHQYEQDRNKPLLEQVREHKDTIDALSELTGGGDKDDDDDEAEAGEGKWWNSPLAQQVASVLVAEGSKLIPSAVEGAKKLRAGPGANSPAVVGQMQARRMPPAMRRNALPARPKNRITFADADGPRMRQSFDDLPTPDTSGDVSQGGGPRIYQPDAPGSVFDEPMVQQQQQPRPAPAQPMQQPVQQPVQQRSAPPQPQQAEAQHPNSPPLGDDWSAFGWLPMPVQDVQSLVLQMNQALVAGASGEELGKTFCANYPTEVIAQLIQIIEIKKLIESIRTCPATSELPLASGKGRRFLADTWQYMQSHVQSQSQAPQAAPQAEPEQAMTDEKETDDV